MPSDKQPGVNTAEANIANHVKINPFHPAENQSLSLHRSQLSQPLTREQPETMTTHGYSALSPDLYAAARTEAFKRDNGDWETVAKATMPRNATSLAEAKEIARAEISPKVIHNDATGLDATVSRNALDKMTSGSAVDKSFSVQAHALAVANLDHLFQNAEPIDIHPDSKGGYNIRTVHRLGAAMLYNGKAVGVKLTVKVFRNPSDGTRIYSVEAIDVGKSEPAGQLVPDAAIAGVVPNTPIAGSQEKLRKLVSTVNPESVTVPLEANGEQTAQAVRDCMDGITTTAQDAQPLTADTPEW